MNRGSVLAQMPAYARPEILISADQDVNDIMRAVLAKHVECEPYYDTICTLFLGSDLWETCENLFDFCQENLTYDIEGKKRQVVSSPQTLLSRGTSDCKCYALFIAGCLDALERKGLLDCTWCYRFASYSIFDSSKGHVFVLVDKGTPEEIWVDPVLNDLDDRYPWPIWVNDRMPYGHSAMANRIGQMAGAPRVAARLAAIGSAESDLLSQLLEYQQGVLDAVHVSLSTGTLNSITSSVLKGAAAAIPGVNALFGALQLAGKLTSNIFGAGSAGARIVNDFSNFNFVGLFNDVFKGRTYNTDQYWGAAFYYFYVEGRDITNQDQVTDDMVIPALRWFIDRTGVFISGRQHIMALINGVQQYISYSKVNGDTTTDTALVVPAVAVAQKYWLLPTRTPSPDYATFDPSLRGTWSKTVGVFDGPLAGVAQQLGLSLEQANKEAEQGIINVPGYTPPGEANNDLLYAGGGVLLLALAAYLLTDNKKRA